MPSLNEFSDIAADTNKFQISKRLGFFHSHNSGSDFLRELGPVHRFTTDGSSLVVPSGMALFRGFRMEADEQVQYLRHVDNLLAKEELGQLDGIILYEGYYQSQKEEFLDGVREHFPNLPLYYFPASKKKFQSDGIKYLPETAVVFHHEDYQPDYSDQNLDLSSLDFTGLRGAMRDLLQNHLRIPVLMPSKIKRDQDPSIDALKDQMQSMEEIYQQIADRAEALIESGEPLQVCQPSARFV